MEAHKLHFLPVERLLGDGLADGEHNFDLVFFLLDYCETAPVALPAGGAKSVNEV